jgi:N-acetyl-anhydromuramyl-L-alanine amidase AmpD
MPLDINKIIQYNLPDHQYYSEVLRKTQIYIHHTAGNSNPLLVVDSWKQTPEKISTAFVIAGKPDKSKSYQDGDIVQGFSSKYWSYHLGIKKEIFQSRNIEYKPLDKYSIGIELCNWGYLKKGQDGKFRTYVNSIVPEEEAIKLDTPFRRYEYWHNYTDAQINALRDLLVYLCDKFNIPKTYNEDMWDVSNKALSGESGIWTHVSVRSDKTDCYPHTKLVTMLKSLMYPQL